MAKKTIEDYYETEWSNQLSRNAVKILIELTCRTYHLNQPHVPSFVREKEVVKPSNLGKI